MKVRSLLVLVILVCSLLVSGLSDGAYPEAKTKGQAELNGTLLLQPTESSAKLPAEVSPGWWATVQDDTAKSEYQVTWQEPTYLADIKAAYQAPNRLHNLRTYFTDHGIRVIPRASTKPDWHWGLSLGGYGFKGDVRPLGRPELIVSANRVEYRHQNVTEWYVNDERGLEHGFTVKSPPKSQNPNPEPWIVFKMDLSGDLSASLNGPAAGVEFTTSGGVCVMRYGELHAFDANGRKLPSRFTLADGGIHILVNASQAVYPVTVDPLATVAAWTAESNKVKAYFGVSVASAGDVNGDTYDDVIVGAHAFDGGKPRQGRVFVYYGSASGLSTTPDWIAKGKQAYAYFGVSVASAGDVNGDGYDDIIIGAQYFDNGQTNEGAAFVYYGSSTGLDLGGSRPIGLTSNANWTAEGNQVGAEFGISVASAGDVNNDTYDDVIVGAYLYDNPETDEGAAFVYHGSSSGLSTTPNWTAEGNQVGAEFGISVASAGDVNNDTYDDVIVGAYLYDNPKTDEGAAFVYHGSGSGLSNSSDWTAEGNQVGAEFGISVASAGDVNNDTYDDVIVGAHLYNNGQTDEGAAFVYHGSGSGLSTTPNWTAESDQDYARFGISVASAGNVNNDTYDDVIVGAYFYDNPLTDGGAAFVYHGSGSGLSPIANWSAGSNQRFAFFGISVASAGDVDGSGESDVIVGAYGYDNLQSNEGRAFVFGPAVTEPVIDDVQPSLADPGDIVSIIGRNFGDGTNGSVHIGANTYSSSLKRIKGWTDTEIQIKIPFRHKPCRWFKDGSVRVLDVWVTVDSVDSNTEVLKLQQHAYCP